MRLSLTFRPVFFNRRSPPTRVFFRQKFFSTFYRRPRRSTMNFNFDLTTNLRERYLLIARARLLFDYLAVRNERSSYYLYSLNILPDSLPDDKKEAVFVFEGVERKLSLPGLGIRKGIERARFRLQFPNEVSGKLTGRRLSSREIS